MISKKPVVKAVEPENETKMVDSSIKIFSQNSTNFKPVSLDPPSSMGDSTSMQKMTVQECQQKIRMLTEKIIGVEVENQKKSRE